MAIKSTKQPASVEALYRVSKYGTWQKATVEFEDKTWKDSKQLERFCSYEIGKNLRLKVVEIRIVKVED